MDNNTQTEDYYFNEEGLLVFTETYHLKRGYCCGNGCKHCPWPSLAPPKEEDYCGEDSLP